jgi:hypothetical protein
MGALEARGLAWPRTAGVGVIGPGSREALERWRARLAGLDAVPVLEPRRAPHDADALLAEPELASLSGMEVAVLRRADGREAWLQTLRALEFEPRAVQSAQQVASCRPLWSVQQMPNSHCPLCPLPWR